MPEKSLIVQGDGTLLLDVHSEDFDKARTSISAFAELERSPEHIHTYRITSLSLWNAASAGLSADAVVDRLRAHSRYPIPDNIVHTVQDTVARFGKLVFLPYGENLKLVVHDSHIELELKSTGRLSKLITPMEGGFLVRLVDRGSLKHELIKLGYPVKDEAPLVEGDRFEVSLTQGSGRGFALRPYQAEAAETFVADRSPGTGFGTIVLPCGAGKTIVGMAVMSMLKTQTLIITTNVASVHQWKNEIMDKTTVTEESIGEYTGDRKIIAPITVATYQILVWRPDKEAEFPHFRLFRERKWGLIIYDEVHLLPAPIFRVTAEIQALRRLGLTATLVREDGREDDVFSLVGPKRYDVPWKELEAKGFIAEASCMEIRADLPDSLRIPYATAGAREKYRIASENPRKLEIARELIQNHPDDSILVIGAYVDQLKSFARELDVPLITGKTPNAEREEIYEDFRRGRARVIVVSKVANFAIDLPDASMAIQVSGTFGSRQEEAQRLGRILRPKKRNSYFYTVVSHNTVEEEFAAKRQRFLTEQGYKYRIDVWEA